MCENDAPPSPGPRTVAAKIVRELGTFARLAQAAERPRIWVLGQKKAGTSVAASFISEGVYGCPAAIDLPVRRWLQRWALPYLFQREPRLAIEMIGRVLRRPVVKEPNLCYHVYELVEALDRDATIVYVTRDRVRHIRSFLDRILERSGDDLYVRENLNFVWRAYLGDMSCGSVVTAEDLARMICRLAGHFEAVDRACQRAMANAPCASLVIRYEDVVQGGGTPGLRRTLTRQWSAFDWERAGRALAVQHQPRGRRIVDERLIAELAAVECSAGASGRKVQWPITGH